MRFRRVPVLVGATILLGCAAALLAALPRPPGMPSGQWRVQRSQHIILTRDGPYRIMVWQPEGMAGPRPLILYAPGWGQSAETGSRQLAYLASHGYVAAAFDDVARDPAPPGESASERRARLASFDDATPAAYTASFAIAGEKVRLAARKGRAILDAIQASPDLAKHIDFGRIGFLGFSFGGATAVEQSISDPRIKAVVNLDGWLFGEAAAKPVDKPYLLFYIDDDFPPEGWFVSADPGERALAQGCAFDRAIHDRLLGKQDFFWLHAKKVSHDDLSGAAPSWQWKHPLASGGRDREALEMRQAAHAQVIRAFFDRYLLGHAAAFPASGQRFPEDIVEISRKPLAVSSRPREPLQPAHVPAAA